MQRKKIILIIIFLSIQSLYLYAFDNDDFQVWYTQNEEFKVSSFSKFILEEELRWADNADHLYYHHHDLGLLFNFKKNNFGFGYRRIYEEKKVKFKIENSPYIIYAYSWDKNILRFNNRLRLEYRHFDYQPDLWRLRNKLDIITSVKLFSLKIHPYIADEVFLNFQNKSFSQNRLFSGFIKDISKALKIDIYFMLQHNRSGKCKRLNIFGTKVKISF